MENKKISITHQKFDLDISVSLKDGPGEWLILLHGIQSNKELFAKLLERPSLSNYSFLAIDSVGFGESSKPEKFSYDIQDQAAVIEQVIKRLSIKKVHLIGHSLGGMIATLLSNSLKDSVISFINMEGNLIYADCGASKMVAGYSFEDFKNGKYADLKSGIVASGESSAPLRVRWLEDIPDYVFYRTSISIVEWSKSEAMLDLFKDSAAKKLFMYGDENSNKTITLPHSIKLAKIPNAGHFMLLDNPAATYQAIEDFLKTS